MPSPSARARSRPTSAKASSRRSRSWPIGTWRGLGAPKGTPPEVLAVLADATRKSAEEPVLREALDRLSMGYAYADAETFRAAMKQDNEVFRQLVNRLGLKT